MKKGKFLSATTTSYGTCGHGFPSDGRTPGFVYRLLKTPGSVRIRPVDTWSESKHTVLPSEGFILTYSLGPWYEIGINIGFFRFANPLCLIPECVI